MKDYFKDTRIGIALVLISLLFGIGLGIGFGVAEDSFKDYISEGIAAHQNLHDAKSPSKIWRYGQRAHFHATGIAAFSIGLVVLVMLSNMKTTFKKAASTLIGLSGLYPQAWFVMFLVAPSIGRDAAHHHWLTEILIYTGNGGLFLGIATLAVHLGTNAFSSSGQPLPGSEPVLNS